MGIKIRWIRNKWYVVIDWHGKRKTIAVGPDRKEAEIIKAQLEAGLLVGDQDGVERILGEQTASTPTLGKYGEKWVQELNLTRRKASTRTRYLQCFRLHIQPCKIAAARLNKIDYASLKEFILELKGRYCVSKPAPLGKNSIKIILVVLRLILEEAEADGHIKGNPAANKKLSQFYRDAGRFEEIHPFTLKEVHQIEDIFKERYPWYYALVVCLFRTGIRAGEARGLEWGDINLHTRKITIRRNWSYGWKVSHPKTTAGRRAIDISSDLVDVLQGWKAQLKEYWLKKGYQDPGLVFPSSTGGPFNSPGFQKRYWTRAQELLGLEIRRVHDTRHTFASLLLSGGVPITRVAYLLGHASVGTTLQFYAHYLPSESDSKDIATILDKNRDPQTTRKHTQTEKGKTLKY